ncbi:tyrosine-type recombinase/integrase, partial [Candidatus Bathyarchaeota archaeon]|nr:tyrosine-type recombinase/integrase [Candidatus Bathyarchaeota archaeon]
CEDCKLRGMTKASITRYKSTLLMFANHFKKTNIVTLNIRMLEEFLGYLKFKRGVKHKTVENNFTTLSSFYDYLVFHGFTDRNLVLPFRRRYLRMYKNDNNDSRRKLLSVEEMSQLVNSILDPRDKAISLVLAKTGVRRGEMLKMDVEDINWTDYSITLKPTPKRSNRIVYFDDETAVVLKRWLKVRENLNPTTKALFISYQTSGRLSRNGAYQAVVKYARNLGFHDPASPRMENHFGPHCFRHWFTTWLLRSDIQREYVKELRGDSRGEAIDIYHHIDREDLRKAYLACIPKLGI